MKKRYRRKRYRSRRRSLSASNWGPLIKLLLCVAGGLLALAVLALGVMIVLEAVFHVDTPLPPDGIVAGFTKLFSKGEDVLVTSPTPYFTPEPTPTPHPMSSYNPEESEKEVVLPAELQYFWFGDPSFRNGKMLFSAGKIVGDNVQMCGLLQYDQTSGSVSELPIKPKNAHFVSPVMNDDWLVYLDAKPKGGGDIRACRIGNYQQEPLFIKTVYIGQPELRLDGHYVSWIERTGTTRDKLFVCDLETLETTVVAMFSSSSYGTSSPYMKNGTLIWAAEGTEHYEDGRMTSIIKHIDLGSSGIRDLSVDTYVHEPEYNGEYFVWIDAHFSENSTLYWGKPNDAGEIVSNKIADGVVVYVYLFNSGESFRITPERELAQLLGATEGHVIWMDVTTRERDVLKYAAIPQD